MNNRKSQAIIVLLILIWTGLILIGYYRSHKPFELDQILILSKAIFQTMIAGIMIILWGGLGKKLYQLLFSTYHPSLTRQLGLGLGVFSILFLVSSACLGIHFWISIGIILGLGLLVFQDSLLWTRQLIKTIAKFHPITNWEKSIFWLILLNLWLTWSTAASPPIKYDALLYHLELPKWYQIIGKFSFNALNDRWGMPQIGEMLYTFIMSIAGDSAATILAWFLGLFALLATIEIFQNWQESRWKWLGFVIPLAGFSFLDSLSWGYIDWLTFFWGALALQALMNRVMEDNPNPMVEVGIFCGFALGTKYTAGALSLAIAIALVWLWVTLAPWRAKELSKQNKQYFSAISQLIRAEITFGLVIFAVTLPWWIKNILATGQPFYPLLFPAGQMTPLRLRFYTIQPVWGNGWTSALLPWMATMLGIEGKVGFSSSIGPLWLLLSPIAWLGYRSQTRERKVFIQLMSIIGIILWLIWGIGARISGLMIQTRFYWSLFPALVVLAVIGYENISKLGQKPLNLIFIIDGVILLVFTLNTLQMVTLTLSRKSPQYIFGIISKEQYLQDNLGWYAIAMDKIRELKPSKPVLLLFEPRDYYCLPYCDSDEILDEWYLRSYRAGTDLVNVESILKGLEKQGYGYVLVFMDGVNFVKQDDKRYTIDQWRLLDQMLTSLKLVENFGKSYLLYQLP